MTEVINISKEDAAILAALTSISEATASKIERIKNAIDYTRTLAYYLATDNATSIIHSGTTSIGAETVTETIAYIDAAGGDFRVLTITFS